MKFQFRATKGGAVYSELLSFQKFGGRVLAGCLVTVCLWGCSKKVDVEDPESVASLLPATFTDTTLAFPKLVFTDGSLSLNDKCPVRKVKLNRRLAPLFVNGRPIGFC